MGRFLICCLISALASTAAAEIFKSVDANGHVVFSDLPPPNKSEKVEVEPINSYEAPAVAAAPPAKTSPGATLDSTYYQVFEVVEPAPDTAIRDNAGNVSIAVALSPALRGDHRLLLTLDGEATEVEAQDNVFVLGNIDRGTHTAGARIVDRSGAVVAEAKPTTFHMLRVAVGQATPTPSKPAN